MIKHRNVHAVTEVHLGLVNSSFYHSDVIPRFFGSSSVRAHKFSQKQVWSLLVFAKSCEAVGNHSSMSYLGSDKVTPNDGSGRNSPQNAQTIQV